MTARKAADGTLGERIVTMVQPAEIAQSVRVAYGLKPFLTLVVVERPNPLKPGKKMPVVLFVPPWLIKPESGDTSTPAT